MYKGEQVIVYGRYTGHGKKTVRLTGSGGGERKTFEYELEFPEYSEDDKHAFVPRLWAGRKVDSLLSKIRKADGESQELVDEVTFLAKRYGIVTPYTSFLVADDVVAQGQPQLAQQFQNSYRAFGAGGYGVPAGGPGLEGAGFATPAAASRPDPAAGLPAAQNSAVAASKRLADFRRGAGSSGATYAFDSAADEALRASGDTGRSSLTAIRYIGSRTFYKSGDVWYDSRFEPAKHQIEKTVTVGSDEYLELIQRDSRLAKYLALGDVVVEVRGKWYRFGT